MILCYGGLIHRDAQYKELLFNGLPFDEVTDACRDLAEYTLPLDVACPGNPVTVAADKPETLPAVLSELLDDEFDISPLAPLDCSILR